MRSFRHHGIDLDFHGRLKTQTWLYDIVSLGFNYRIPDINCALGTSQMYKLPTWLARRREIARQYNDGLGDLGILDIPSVRNDCNPAWHLYVVRLRLDRLSVTRARFFEALRAENIGVNVHYIPIPWLSYYQSLGYIKGNWPVAEAQYERMLSLPIFPAMTDEDVSDVIIAVRKLADAYRLA